MKKIFLVGCLIILAGCTTTQKGATLGSLGGATLGGIIGHQSGKGIEGAAIGGAAGALGGILVGEKLTKKFCPTGGEQYDASVKFCPKHGVELKDIEK